MSKNDDTFNKISNIVLAKGKVIADTRFIDLEKDIKDIITKSQNRFFKDVANVMDKENPPSFYEGVTWGDLSYTYQMKKGNNRKWRSPDDKNALFRDTRIHLQDFFKQIRSVRYYYKDDVIVKSKPWTVKNKRVTYRDIYVKSSLHGKRSPFHVDDNSASKTKKTQEVKIQGNEEKRPLIEPMRLFYVKHHLPRRLNVELRHKYPKVKFTSA